MELQFEINKPSDLVFDYLTNMQKFVTIHPVITKIDPKGDNNYLVHETLKFGGIPFSFTYPVTVDSNSTEQTITIKATVFGITKVEMNFKVAMREHNSCYVHENIQFKSPLPIKGMMRKIFKTQHALLFKNMVNIN